MTYVCARFASSQHLSLTRYEGAKYVRVCGFPRECLADTAGGASELLISNSRFNWTVLLSFELSVETRARVQTWFRRRKKSFFGRLFELILRILWISECENHTLPLKKWFKASATTIIYPSRTRARKISKLDSRRKKTRPDVLSSSALKRMKYRNSLGLIVQIQFRTFLQIKESPHRKRGFGGGKLRFDKVLHEWFFMFVLTVLEFYHWKSSRITIFTCAAQFVALVAS